MSQRHECNCHRCPDSYRYVTKQDALQKVKEGLLSMSKEDFMAKLEKHKDGPISEIMKEVWKDHNEPMIPLSEAMKLVEALEFYKNADPVARSMDVIVEPNKFMGVVFVGKRARDALEGFNKWRGSA